MNVVVAASLDPPYIGIPGGVAPLGQREAVTTPAPSNKPRSHSHGQTVFPTRCSLALADPSTVWRCHSTGASGISPY